MEKNGLVKVTQSCPTLCNPIDYIVHGILQARIQEWLAFPASRGSSQGSNPGLPHCRWNLYQLGHKGSTNKMDKENGFTYIWGLPRI